MAKKTQDQPELKDVMSVAELRAARAVDAVVPAFVQWCKDTHGLSAEDAMNFLQPVKVLVLVYFDLTSSSSATDFEPEPFGRVLGGLYEARDGVGGGDDAVVFAFESAHLYVEFLGLTGAWTGTEEDYERIHALFHMDEDDAAAELDGPDLAPEEELASLEGTALASRLTVLLKWLGDGKDVTSTGLLRLKDLEAASAAVGVRAKGGKPNAKRQQKPFFDGANLPTGEILTVRSMNELPDLMKFWVSMQASGLIKIGSTRAWPTAFTAEFLAPGHPGRLGILRDFVAKYLLVAVHGEAHWDPWIADAAMVESELLFEAASGKSAGLEQLDELVNTGEPTQDTFVAGVVRSRLQGLSELGLLTMDPGIQVLPALKPAVAAVMQHALSLSDAEGDDDWEDMAGINYRGGPAPKPGRQTRLLQLKVMLKGSKPPVWRRLIVRSDINLAQLHHIIQRAFGWMNCHLHEFRVCGYNGTAYGPVGPEYDFGDPMPNDEAGATVGQVLSKEKDKLDYVYDFGDNWDHAITLEKTLVFDGGPAARCTGGRGAGPAEDSGGVWGWENISTIMADPAHPEHDEYRLWLGLEDGEVFDPKRFDADSVDEILSEMY